MDPLTHALTGAAISDAWFRRRLGPVATPFALAAAVLPDIDVPVAWLAGAENVWADHRGYSHSFFTLLPVALFLGFAVDRFRGGGRGNREENGGDQSGCGEDAVPGGSGPGNWPRWFLLALCCLYSHVVLDLSNSWGTMPFLPFSSWRASLDAAPVVDVFIFSLTLASFVINRLLRRERLEEFANPLAYPVVHRRPDRIGLAAGLAWPAIILSALYLAVGWLQSLRVADLARRELARSGVEAVETRAMPLPFTWLAWSIAARDADGTVYNALYSSFAPAPLEFSSCAAASDSAAELALASPAGGKFIRFCQGMYSVESLEAVHVGEPGESGFAGRLDGGTVRFPDRKAPEAGIPSGARILVEIRDRRFFSLAPPWRPRFGLDVFLDANLTMLAARDWSAGAPSRSDLADEWTRLWRLVLDGRADVQAL